MGVIARYVVWRGHDAGGLMPPEDVVAGILVPNVWRLPPSWPPLDASETLVYVPPQWIGSWEHGHALAPAYQHVWRARYAGLESQPPYPRHHPYRPAILPASAIGPRSSPPARGARPTTARTP